MVIERLHEAAEKARKEALELEKADLKRLVANLSLDNLVLKDFASGNVWSAPFLQAQFCFWHIAVCVNVSGLSRVGRFWRPGHDEIRACRSQ